MKSLRVITWIAAAFVLVSVGTSTAQILAQEGGAEAARDTNDVNDVTDEVVFVGNPFRERHFDPQWTFARNVWDMEVFEGRLYLGSGNSNNIGPARNAGPIEVWYYDDIEDAFDYDYIVNDEQIDKFVVSGDTLYIPGHDSRGDSKHGNIYFLQGGNWIKRDNVPGALHVYDLYVYRDYLFVALGRAKNDSLAVAMSSDLGQDWTLGIFPTYTGALGEVGVGRSWQFFEVGGSFYLSVEPIPKIKQFPDEAYVFDIEGYSSFVYRLGGIDANSVAQFEDTTIDFFAGVYPPNYAERNPPRITRLVQFGSHVVYLGAVTVIDHNWQPFGLFSIDSANNVEQYNFVNDALPRDLFVHDGIFYLLLTVKGEIAHEMRVMTTCDLQHWDELFRFQSATFSRSFARYNGNYYFGQGTEDTPSSTDAGNILMVRGSLAAQFSCSTSN